MKLLCILMLAIFLQACALQKPKHEVIYMSSSAEQWKKAKLHECNMEVQVIVLSVFEVRIGTPQALTKEDVQELHKRLMDSCANYHKLTV